MLRIFKILLLFLASYVPVFAYQTEQSFTEANQLYQEGQFEQAVASYEAILRNGFESGDLYFNLGNAYYKLGQLGKARVNYERALLWLEGDESIEHNLEMLKLRLVDQIEPPPRLFISVWWDFVLDLFKTNVFGNIFLITFWIVLVVAGIFMHYRRRGRIRMKGVLVSVSLIWIFVGIIWVNKVYLSQTEKYGVILNSSVTVYAEPVKETTELFVIHEGTRVKIERSNADWLEIKLADGKTGWLTKDNLEVI